MCISSLCWNEESQAAARFQTLILGAKLPKLHHIDIKKSSKYFTKNMDSVRIKLMEAWETHGSISTESAFIGKINRFWF